MRRLAEAAVGRPRLWMALLLLLLAGGLMAWDRIPKEAEPTSRFLSSTCPSASTAPPPRTSSA